MRDVGRIVQESDQSTGRPGRASAPGSSHRSAFEEADWHGLPEAQFAKDIADRLYRALMRHEFDRLVIAAPPKALGELRRDLHKEVAARVVTDIGKDLTNSTLDDIEAHVRDALAAATGGRVTIDQPDELAAGGKRFGARRD